MRMTVLIGALLLLGCGERAEAPIDDDAADGAPAIAHESGPEGRQSEPANADAPTGASGQHASACLIQDGERISENAIVVIGTEPFWGARVEGRCVTYSTPEDQEGTRIWAKFSGSAANGRWTGALDGQPFVMVTRPQKGCSDGMSDNLYPIAVTLTVRGEERTGCAESKSEREKRRPA